MGIFNKFVIPIPIPVLTGPGIGSKVESVPHMESVPRLKPDQVLESIPIKEGSYLNGIESRFCSKVSLKLGYL